MKFFVQEHDCCIVMIKKKKKNENFGYSSEGWKTPTRIFRYKKNLKILHRLELIK